MAEEINPDKKITGVDPSLGASGDKQVMMIYRLYDDTLEPPQERSMLVYLDGSYDIFAAGGGLVSSGMYEDLEVEPEEGVDEEGYNENTEDRRPDSDDQDSDSSE